MGGISVTATEKVHITEKHLHPHVRWMAKAAIPVGETHVADRFAPGAATAFQIDAGNNTWGAWVQILGSLDTPINQKSKFYDPQLLFVSTSERNLPYLIQFAHGNSPAEALAVDEFTEMVYASLSIVAERIAVPCYTDRHRKGTKLWARCFCPTQDTGTLDFFLGLHEYAYI